MSPSVRSRRRAPAVLQKTAGPFVGVRTTLDIGDDPSNLLYDATNLYSPDPKGSSGMYALPGCSLQNNGVPIVTSTSTFRGQGVFTHIALDGTVTNFAVWDGRLIRCDNNNTVFTDVTPVGITIDDAVTTRVYGTSFADQLVITDGVNRPWLATALTASPITGTSIDFDSVAGSWSAFGPAVVYGGSIFFVLAQVTGTAARTDIAWSLAGNAALGYQQTDFDFRWTLEQTAADPLYALAGTNTQLYYFRESSIGSISGTPGPDLSSTPTHDSISRNVGTLSPQAILQFGTSIFFVDALGRPYRLQQGTAEPEAIWLQMRAIVDTSSFGFPGINKTVATAGFEPTLNLYIVAPWSAAPGQTGPATEGYTFDARTGSYFGRFQVADGIQLDTLGTFIDANGRGQLIIQGSATPPGAASIANSGYLWSLNSLVGTGDFLTTEAGVYLTTEDAVPVFLTTEGTLVNWDDGAAPKVISATTNRIGYDEDTVIVVDRVGALVGSTAPITVSCQTAAVIQTVEGTPTPSTVQDGVSRLTCGFDGMQGRGASVTVSPTTTNDQWSIQQVSLRGIISRSAPDEV